MRIIGITGGRGWKFSDSTRRSAQRTQRAKCGAASNQGGAFQASHSRTEILGNPVVRAGIISGSLSLVGDLLAQFLSCAQTRSSYDPARSFRMGSFGLLLYGPYQHYWYNALDGALPARTLTNFALKVFMNQACLAPVVVAGVFTWNLGLQGKLESLSSKCKRDFVPTLVTGWKFWVPAATVNFTMIPLQHQVLYMSACGVIWTAFLSYSSSSSSTESKPNIVYSAK